MIYNDGKAGFLTVITGCMFSEKSGDLIQRCKKAKLYQKKKVLVYKPEIDYRFSDCEVVSRIGLKFESQMLQVDLEDPKVKEIIVKQCEEVDLVAFDEVQFFSKSILDIVWHLVNAKKHVIVAGLNLDFLGRPFGYTKELAMYADEFVLKNAYCHRCGRPAGFTQRIVNEESITDTFAKTVEIGGDETYEARCRLCFETGK